MKRSGFVAITLLFFCLLISIAAYCQSSQPQEKTLLNKGQYIPSIATFLQIGGNSIAGYSWDGSKVFFVSSMSGAAQVYRINKEGWPYQLSAFPDGIDFFVLSHNADLGIVGASVGGSEQSQLYLMDAMTGRVVQLTKFDGVQMGSVAWSPDNKSIYYRSNEENKRDFFIYEMNIADGSFKKVFGEVPGYNAVADVSQDGTRLLVVNYSSNVNCDLYMIDLTTGKFQKLNDDDSDVIYGSPTLMPDNKTIWLTCNGNEDGISRLATMTVGSPKVNYVDDGWIDPKWEIDGLGFSRDYKRMAATVNEDGYVNLKLREVDSKKVLKSPPLAGIQGGGIFDENGSCLTSFTGPTRAPDIWRWNPTTGEFKQLTFATYAGINRDIFTDPTLVHYKSFDGLEIPAFLYLPPDYKKGTPIPFIVDAHGGPEGQFQPAFLRNYQYLMLNGYGILAPNPRGSSGYGLKYLNMDNYKLRKNSLKDYKAGVDWLMSEGYTEKGMVGIRGGSYGGYVVLGMITEYPDLFSAAVDEVGIANFKTFLRNTAPYRRALRESEYGPLSDTAFLDEISPINKVDLIKTPLMVVHGENDPRVPVGEARQIIAGILNNGGQVDSLIFPDEGHGASKRSNIVMEYEKQVKFFNHYLRQDQAKMDD
jgi:dipeptidyl aminopeptidase/acylaminoacyl peptidase